jgi:hypothetical protein
MKGARRAPFFFAAAIFADLPYCFAALSLEDSLFHARRSGFVRIIRRSGSRAKGESAAASNCISCTYFLLSPPSTINGHSGVPRSGEPGVHSAAPALRRDGFRIQSCGSPLNDAECKAARREGDKVEDKVGDKVGDNQGDKVGDNFFLSSDFNALSG